MYLTVLFGEMPSLWRIALLFILVFYKSAESGRVMFNIKVTVFIEFKVTVDSISMSTSGRVPCHIETRT